MDFRHCSHHVNGVISINLTAFAFGFYFICRHGSSQTQKINTTRNWQVSILCLPFYLLASHTHYRMNSFTYIHQPSSCLAIVTSMQSPTTFGADSNAFVQKGKVFLLFLFLFCVARLFCLHKYSNERESARASLVADECGVTHINFVCVCGTATGQKLLSRISALATERLMLCFFFFRSRLPRLHFVICNVCCVAVLFCHRLFAKWHE